MKEEFSAGGVLLKDGEVLLIKNPSDVWTFPKGLVESGENPEETAIREVSEETGVKGKIVAPIGEIRYWYMREGERIKKKVLFYLMEYLEGEPRPSWEVKDAKFFPLEEAKRLLKYKGDKEIFKKALEMLYYKNK
ncbi:MAG: NUDIX hydrolase [Aquificota bacterium]|nr:NUDIX hydrolase [Aquificaceae bacterium]MDM7266141.1 NUDIX hydrolase [Aquificaceae bacterium]HAV40445.1 NUDIX hydrolase [Aquificaceae bacterium]HCO38986.1 NUDIX hydrolase [Aquificaceae bacterium]